ncbi:hypothetical protein D3C84_672800 [compost metagenome]
MPGVSIRVFAGLEKEKRRTAAQLSHQRQMGGKVIAAMEVPQDNMPTGGDEACSRGVMGRPQLHVGGIGRVADIQWIE